MNLQIQRAIDFLRTCSLSELRQKLREIPADWRISFGAESLEYDAVLLACDTNSAFANRKYVALSYPTAIKLVNLM